MATTVREDEGLRPPFLARYPGECCLCGLWFSAGDLITALRTGDRAMYAHSDCDEGTAAVPEFDSAGVLSPAQRGAVLEILASPEYRSLEYATRARHDYDHADRREGDNDF